MMFSIRSFVLYAVGTSMCGGLLVLLCLPSVSYTHLTLPTSDLV